MEEKQVLYDSDDAASYQTGIEGWVSRTGFFFGNKKESEHLARYEGCTHRKCACGNFCERSWIACKACRQKKDEEKYASLEKIPWDGKSPVCTWDGDTYFFHGIGEVEDYCEDHGIEKESLKLLHCDPVALPTFDLDYHFEGVMFDDDDVRNYLSQDVIDAAEALNDAIEKMEPFSYEPGAKAVLWPLI